MSHKPLEQTDISAHYCDEPILAHDVPFRDYLAQYGEQRTEWLMGAVIQHMANNKRHQVIQVFLTALLRAYLQYRQIGQVFSAGYAMYISDAQPARQPDLLVVLNANVDRIQDGFVQGHADLVIEMVSPESSQRDYGPKLVEYEAAQVPEYWLIDPLRQDILLYQLSASASGEADARYRRLSLDADARLHSQILPGFYLEPNLLWHANLATVDFIEMAQRMAADDVS